MEVVGLSQFQQVGNGLANETAPDLRQTAHATRAGARARPEAQGTGGDSSSRVTRGGSPYVRRATVIQDRPAAAMPKAQRYILACTWSCLTQKPASRSQSGFSSFGSPQSLRHPQGIAPFWGNTALIARGFLVVLDRQVARSEFPCPSSWVVPALCASLGAEPPGPHCRNRRSATVFHRREGLRMSSWVTTMSSLVTTWRAHESGQDRAGGHVHRGDFRGGSTGVDIP